MAVTLNELKEPNDMGLFIDVTELAGDCVVQGQVRRCAYSGGTHTNGELIIKGLTLTEALAVLKALGSDSIAGVHLTGVLPVPGPQQAAPPASRPVDPPTPADAPVSTENPQARAAREAGWRDAGDVLAQPPPRGQVSAAEVNAMPPAHAPQGGLPGVDAPAQAVAPSAPPAAPQGAATGPQQPAGGDVPDDVLKAATLRPVVGWLHEQGVSATVDAMYPQVRAIIARMAKSSPLSRLADDELRTRIKSTLERLELLRA